MTVYSYGAIYSPQRAYNSSYLVDQWKITNWFYYTVKQLQQMLICF